MNQNTLPHSMGAEKIEPKPFHYRGKEYEIETAQGSLLPDGRIVMTVVYLPK